MPRHDKKDSASEIAQEIAQALAPLVQAWIQEAVQTACSQVLQGMSAGFPAPPSSGSQDLEGTTEVLPQRPEKRRARAH